MQRMSGLAFLSFPGFYFIEKESRAAVFSGKARAQHISLYLVCVMGEGILRTILNLTPIFALTYNSPQTIFYIIQSDFLLAICIIDTVYKEKNFIYLHCRIKTL
jgi:hypothetical protein